MNCRVYFSLKLRALEDRMQAKQYMIFILSI
jgi:hypothetical protein